MSANSTKIKIGWKTAAGIVIANMIGTGVFTSLGFQIADIRSTWSIILLWVIGGILSLIGAFSFAELATHFKKSGGEYIYLSRVFHPFLGYISAFTSLTVGFPAPVALAAIAMVDYLSPWGIDSLWLAATCIILISVMHSFSLKQSSIFQDYTTAFKLIFVFVLIVLGFWFPPFEGNAFNYDLNLTSEEIFLPGFAVSLIYVTYAYTGWNSAAYIIEEIKEPRKNVPLALIGSVIFVTVLYILMQLVLLKHASVDQLTGKTEVALISFGNLFGTMGENWVSICIAIQLVATISGYTWIAPRVTKALASEFSLWKPLAKTNKNNIPINALWFHTAVCLFFTFTGSFEFVLTCAGFTLQLITTLAVASLLFIKHQKPDTYKSPLKPFTQILYVVFSLGVLIYVGYDKPMESLAGLGFLTLGGITYLFNENTIATENE